MTEYDEQLLVALSTGKATLFLGAGFALGGVSDRPGGSRDKPGLKQHLARSFRQSLELDTPHTLDDLSMEDLVLYLESRAGIARRTIEDSIRQFLASSQELAALESFSLLRTLIQRKPDMIDVIITTNWDAGIEASLDDLPAKVRVVVGEGDTGVIERGQIALYKIHGDISRHEPELVISSEDFDLFEKTHPLTIERLRNVLSSRSLIVLGSSGRDDNFRRLMRHLSFDLRGRLMGGWIISPELPAREKLWTSQVGLRHVPSTSQEFLRSALTFATTDFWGSARSMTRGAHSSSKLELLSPDDDLRAMARVVQSQFGLRDVWIIRRRSQDSDANSRIETALSCYIENRASSLASIALSTGRTVEYATLQVDASYFTRVPTLYSTVTLLNSKGAFRDPCAIVDQLAGRFQINRCRAKLLRISGFPESLSPSDHQTVSKLARSLTAEAVQADMIVSSVRPWDWYGLEAAYEKAAQGRTQPFTALFKGNQARIGAAMRRAKVAAIHQMIPLNSLGEDVSEKLVAELGVSDVAVFRPSTEELQQAAGGRQTVVLAATAAQKSDAVRAVLRGKLCNTLIIDFDLAGELLLDRPARNEE